MGGCVDGLVWMVMGILKGKGGILRYPTPLMIITRVVDAVYGRPTSSMPYEAIWWILLALRFLRTDAIQQILHNRR